jgi:hypothetical protein
MLLSTPNSPNVAATSLGKVANYADSAKDKLQVLS